MTKLAERMQGAVRQTLQEAQASFEALAVGRQEREAGQTGRPGRKSVNGRPRGQGAAPGRDAAAGEPAQGLQAEGQPLWRWMGRLRTHRALAVQKRRSWGQPGVFIRRGSVTHPDFSSNIVGFEWLADKMAFREWMSKLHWQAPTYTIGWGREIHVSPEQDPGPPQKRRSHSEGRVGAGSGWYEVGVRDYPDARTGDQGDIEGDNGLPQELRAPAQPFQIPKVTDDGTGRCFFQTH